MRFHVHAIVRDLMSDDEIASVTVSLNADDDGEAQTKAWEIFDDDLVTVDVVEIEEANELPNDNTSNRAITQSNDQPTTDRER